MSSYDRRRQQMVSAQIAARGVRDQPVLDAMTAVPRERFVPHGLVEFAYEDNPLPIDERQTVSQPYIVALMAEAAELTPDSRILEVGAGSGYAAAVFSEVGAEVFTIERHRALADSAKQRLLELGYDRVHVRHGDGTKGWPEHAPFDAIIVAAAGPDVPRPLLEQMAIGGRLVIPVGEHGQPQSLIRVRRVGEAMWERESLGSVAFVPLVPEVAVRAGAPLPEAISSVAERFETVEEAPLDGLLERIGDKRLVLLGEATHGTSEFYRMRDRITRALIEKKGFSFVAVEADWPDAAFFDRHARGLDPGAGEHEAFARFPRWMWLNREVMSFIRWLREHNRGHEPVGFHGLDLYSMHGSMQAVIDYLEDVDPEAARLARVRYGCLEPWAQNPASYGAAALSGRYRECEDEVVEMLQRLLQSRYDYAARDGDRYMDAAQNARLVANAERYYRVMYYGAARSWNQRDDHMFETLKELLTHYGEGSKAVVWAHNSHLGNAAATEMSARGEHNLGQLCRVAFGEEAYLVGFGTDHGTVAAASSWDGPMERKRVRPALEGSYERVFHETGDAGLLLPLGIHRTVREGLARERLERAIGVLYLPESERLSHYFHARLPEQFDEYIWIDETSAVEPLAKETWEGPPETFPFGV